MSTQPSTQARVSIREYARQRGVSDAAVRKWIKAGRIPVHPDGIDPAEADAAVRANQSGSQAIRIAVPSAEPIAPPSAPPAPPAPALVSPAQNPAGSLLDLIAAAARGGEEDGPTRADSERELAALKAERARLALERERGEVVAVVEVERAVGEMITQAKDRLMLVPSSIADQLAGLKDPIACCNVVEHAIRGALEGLSQDLRQVRGVAA